MKVKDLIEKLQTLDGDLEVKTHNDTGCVDSVESLEKQENYSHHGSKPYYLLS